MPARKEPTPSGPARHQGETAALPSSGEQARVATAFRQALRRLGGGVCIIATLDQNDRPCGLMMTAVMSLSLDPPSMLLAINRQASALPAILDRGLFSVNVPGAHDLDKCQAFAMATADSRFVADDWQRHPSGIPVYGAALAQIICRIDQAEPFGSHMVIRGLVCDAIFAPAACGLVYIDGAMHPAGVADQAGSGIDSR